MGDGDRRFWPFKPRFSLIGVTIILLAFLSAAAVLRRGSTGPARLPIALALMDVIIERGAIVQYGGVKIDFSRSQARAPTGFAVAPNIGVQGQPVTDSSTTQIIDTLRRATASEIAIIDLEDGKAWWETRLLVLLAGAARLKKPDKIVFLGTDAKVEHRFEGWAYTADLLPCLVSAHPQYRRSLLAAWAAARQWELVEPLDAPVPLGAVPIPPPPPWLSGRLAQAHSWMAFDPATGLPNELFAEQLLQSDLGQKIETQEGPRSITLTRLEELFRTVLNRGILILAGRPSVNFKPFWNIRRRSSL
jgi:hypothetical protein